VIQKDCSVDDETIGRLYVTLTETEMQTLEEGFYDYSVIQETRVDIDSSDYQVTDRVPLFLDSQYGAIGTIEVAGDLLGGHDPSLVVDTFNYINPATHGEIDPKYYISSIIAGRDDLYTANSLHTFQFYFDNYTGDVLIQGSLDPSASPAAGEWIDLKTVDPAADKYANITGKWNWFRIKHTPDENNTGTLDKVLYR